MQQLEEKDQEMNELETTLFKAQDELREYQRQQSPEWVISRDHIKLTSTFSWQRRLGKCCRRQILWLFGCGETDSWVDSLSLQPRIILARDGYCFEMPPPLLAAIHRSYKWRRESIVCNRADGNKFSTLLEQRALFEAELSVVSLDVARALNYLTESNHPLSFNATSAVQMCYFGDRVNIGEARCQIMELPTLWSRPWQLPLMPWCTVLLKHLLKIQLSRLAVICFM